MAGVLVSSAAQALQMLVHICKQVDREVIDSPTACWPGCLTDLELVWLTSWLVNQLSRPDRWARPFLPLYCGSRSSALSLDKEAIHDPQQKVTSPQRKKQKHCRGAREQRRRGGELPGRFTQKCKEADIQLI